MVILNITGLVDGKKIVKNNLIGDSIRIYELMSPFLLLYQCFYYFILLIGI